MLPETEKSLAEFLKALAELARLAIQAIKREYNL
jgi:hypothetical protein